MLLLMLALQMVPLVENPASTLINQHRRFAWLVKQLRELGVSVTSLNVLQEVC